MIDVANKGLCCICISFALGVAWCGCWCCCSWCCWLMFDGGFGVDVHEQFVCSNRQRALAKSVNSEILPLALPAMIGLG